MHCFAKHTQEDTHSLCDTWILKLISQLMLRPQELAR